MIATGVQGFPHPSTDHFGLVLLHFAPLPEPRVLVFTSRPNTLLGALRGHAVVRGSGFGCAMISFAYKEAIARKQYHLGATRWGCRPCLSSECCFSGWLSLFHETEYGRIVFSLFDDQTW